MIERVGIRELRNNVAAVVVAGIAASIVATRAALRGNILQALKTE